MSLVIRPSLRRLTERVCLLCCALLAGSAVADEGMWPVDGFPSRLVAESHDIEIDDAWIDALRRASVRLEGGCSGAFVSGNGLILTNRHCVANCLNEHSSEEANRWQDGFVATSPGAELTCPNQQISVLDGTTDITDKIARVTAGLDDAAANEARKQAFTRLEQECVEAAAGRLVCEVESLYHGGRYFLYKYRRYRDVRLAFAADADIGEFGGDPDNFNFPRWVLDMALLRVYEDDQTAATPDYLTWRVAGPQPGETVFASGHPGSTQRRLTVAELRFLREVVLPNWLMRYSELRGRYLQFARQDEEAARLAQDAIRQLENSIKLRRNQLAALLDDDRLGRKQTQEHQLRDAVAADPALAATSYAWFQIEKAQQAFLPYRDQYVFNEGRGGLQGELFRFARDLVRAAEQRQKPNRQRLREYTDSVLPSLEQRIAADTPIPKRLELLRVSFGLDKMREYLGPDDPFVRKVLGNESPDSMAALLVDGTRLDDVKFRLKLWKGGAKAIRQSKDPMIRLARAVDGDAMSLRQRYEDEYEAPIAQAHEMIAAAYFAIVGTETYPDATFALRVTYGAVEGWDEYGSEVYPFTTLDQLFQRATGKPPFELPSIWLSAESELDPATRFNFVSSLDMTGGNSGSPIVDAKGRLVGLAFDGNRHAIAGTYWYDPERNRAIAVHPAIMWIALENVYRADYVLEELRDAAR